MVNIIVILIGVIHIYTQCILDDAGVQEIPLSNSWRTIAAITGADIVDAVVGAEGVVETFDAGLADESGEGALVADPGVGGVVAWVGDAPVEALLAAVFAVHVGFAVGVDCVVDEFEAVGVDLGMGGLEEVRFLDLVVDSGVD